ncbi:MAG: putative sensor protein [Myxococcaceae bacterium]|nr:putative sensor protein [Myxococcaceae bacterium]
MTGQVKLEELVRCFEGIIPCVIATAAPDGTPNVTYVSQVSYVDSQHVALSRQFFNKTQQNLESNPRASLQFYDPLTFHAYQAAIRFDHSETSGALFDAMAARIQMIATHIGMEGVFKLVAADVCEVVSLERVENFLMPGAETTRLSHVPGVMTELRGLQLISDRINRARDMEELLNGALQQLQESFGLAHSMVLLLDESGERLVTIASRGYGTSGIGAEARVGQGVIGTVAATRRLFRVSGLGQELRYGRAIRGRVRDLGGDALLTPEIPLPGLANAASQLALPMLVGDELIGVLVFESEDNLAMRLWHESYMQILANQIAMGLERLREEDDEPAAPAQGGARSSPPVAPAKRATVPYSDKPRKFLFFRNDDCVFVDGEYLVRNVPGKILWKILNQQARVGRTQFTNRELRLDPTLGLPPVKDNLESRLILLRKRLAEKCPEVALVPTQRGRFALELGCPIELEERDHG